ncbi:MAG: hypothetical protein MUE73_09210 [Planctomycetes bacterium]|jgi:tetratricopeptide (TPR) repeat protein|nr:hypothetical protein [Planctomycetota bacterium]
MASRSQAALTALLALALLAGCGDFREGLSAFEAGRFEEARDAFARAEEEASGTAGAEVLYNRALAALLAGDHRDAEAAAARAAERGDGAVAGPCALLRGCVAFSRSEIAAEQARGPGAEPFALQVAVRYAEAARDFFRDAAVSRPDWPEARRNFERAVSAIEALQREKAEADRNRERVARPDLPPEPDLPPPPEEVSPSEEADPETRVLETELAPAQVRRLLDRLVEKEREKLALRRSEQRARAAEVEKDW